MQQNKRRRTNLRLFATLLKMGPKINVILRSGAGEPNDKVFRASGLQALDVGPGLCPQDVYNAELLRLGLDHQCPGGQ